MDMLPLLDVAEFVGRDGLSCSIAQDAGENRQPGKFSTKLVRCATGNGSRDTNVTTGADLRKLSY
jgi:hypothetical protein